MGERGLGLAIGQDAELVKGVSKWVREAAVRDGKPVPFFVKLTPNITNINEIARAAKEGGADGVTATNTVSGLINMRSDATAWPSMRINQRTTYGGLSGNIIRPIAMRAVSSIANEFPGFPIMATGGVDSADVTLNYIHVGASVVQVSSAIQNQDFTIVQDYISGLRMLLYINSHPAFAKWKRGQSPPLSKRVREVGKGLPRFGDFERKRRQLIAEDIAKNGMMFDQFAQDELVGDEFDATGRPSTNIKVRTVQDELGRALDRIGAWGELDPDFSQHVVALIDESLCVNCGRCYMACNDTAYLAISFDPETHLPHVDTDRCTGCHMCVDVSFPSPSSLLLRLLFFFLQK